MAKGKRSPESVESYNGALIGRFRDYALALESGKCTSGNAEDMESLVENMENLAGEIRDWAGLKKS